MEFNVQIEAPSRPSTKVREIDAPCISGIEYDNSSVQRERLERYGVKFDETGQPVWYTVPEWFDELDGKLIAHFGEEYRELANKRRMRWNSRGTYNGRQPDSIEVPPRPYLEKMDK